MTSTPPLPSLDWCLFLDVDGTLIELSDSPLDTHADPGLKTLLGNVAERLGGALALVSGRSIEYLDALFAPLRLPAAGLHGVERRKASGVMHGASFVDAQLDRARTALAALVTAHPGTLLEDKGRTIAVHFRMAPNSEAAVLEAVRASAALIKVSDAAKIAHKMKTRRGFLPAGPHRSRHHHSQYIRGKQICREHSPQIVVDCGISRAPRSLRSE